MRLATALAAGLLAGGCGLLNRPDPIGFRTYTLRDCGLDEAVAVVRDTTRRYAGVRFGGSELTWDAELANLTLDPVFSGPRRMKLYIHFAPAGPDVDVEMFALVETLDVSGGSNVGWGNPMQDVPLQEELFQQCVTALLERRDARP